MYLLTVSLVPTSVQAAFQMNFCFRFLKHTSKPKDKSRTARKLAERKDTQTEEVTTEDTPKPRGVTAVVSDDKLEGVHTPGKLCFILLILNEA